MGLRGVLLRGIGIDTYGRIIRAEISRALYTIGEQSSMLIGSMFTLSCLVMRGWTRVVILGASIIGPPDFAHACGSSWGCFPSAEDTNSELDCVEHRCTPWLGIIEGGVDWRESIRDVLRTQTADVFGQGNMLW